MQHVADARGRAFHRAGAEEPHGMQAYWIRIQSHKGSNKSQRIHMVYLCTRGVPWSVSWILGLARFVGKLLSQVKVLGRVALCHTYLVSVKVQLGQGNQWLQVRGRARGGKLIHTLEIGYMS